MSVDKIGVLLSKLRQSSKSLCVLFFMQEIAQFQSGSSSGIGRAGGNR